MPWEDYRFSLQIRVQIPDSSLPRLGLLRDPSPLDTISSCPPGPSAYPTHWFSGNLTFQPLPSYPHLAATTGFSPPDPHRPFLPTWCPFSLTSPHDPFPELKPDLTLKKVGLTVSLFCPQGKIQTLGLGLQSRLLSLPSMASSFLALTPTQRHYFPLGFLSDQTVRPDQTVRSPF